MAITPTDFDDWVRVAKRGERIVYMSRAGSLSIECEAAWRRVNREIRQHVWRAGPRQLLVRSSDATRAKERVGAGLVTLVQRRRPDGGLDYLAERL